ncbi:MAG: aminoacyl-tRNA hydrolase [Candidatus Peregrinibacteria bacterium]
MKPDLIIVGLGNPGKQYEHTRHNAGFQAVNILAGEGEWGMKPKLLAEVCEIDLGGKIILLVRPQTFMNRSGECIAKILGFYKLNPATQLLVMCDDIDVKLGEIRYRASGGPGTHNGLKSIVEHIGEGFPRLRIGLGTPSTGTDLAVWVLSAPPPEEGKILEEVIQKILPLEVAKLMKS